LVSVAAQSLFWEHAGVPLSSAPATSSAESAPLLVSLAVAAVAVVVSDSPPTSSHDSLDFFIKSSSR
jgi:hypothetical protein